MKRYPLALFSGLLAAPQAFAAATVADTDERLRASASGRDVEQVQVAQAYEFDVYIDQYGREVVVEPRTGRVVEIRPPVAQPLPPRAERRAQELGRGYYDFTDPRDVERFHRDREAAIARGWDGPPPRYEEPGYPPNEYPYGNSRDPYRDPGYGDYEEYPPAGRDYGSNPRSSEDWAVRREPLPPPSAERGGLAAVPPDMEPGLPDSPAPGQLRPGLPSSDLQITVPGARKANEEVAAFQILLDRAGASPGVIDGHIGDNVNKAIEAYYEITGQRLRTYDKEWIEAELERTGGPAFIEYTITAEDAAGPYVASIPEDYGEKAKLDRLGYTRVTEMLAERFHMDEKYLIDLNPGANFNRPGTIVRVANVGKPLGYEVARLVADKSRKQLRVYDGSNRLVAAYPATIGSSDTPSPTGTHEVARIALNPEYTYNPKINFKQGNNHQVLTIPPGPNGPVGSVWIALSKPTYGIHGTPEPSKIGKTYSHGCIRLTNWDAEELAKRVKPGVTVEFAD